MMSLKKVLLSSLLTAAALCAHAQTGQSPLLVGKTIRPSCGTTSLSWS
jgi:hypothetical protein